MSPDGETYIKIDFYAEHGVDELIIVDPQLRIVRIWQLMDGKYAETGRSNLLHVTAVELTRDIDWP